MINSEPQLIESPLDTLFATKYENRNMRRRGGTKLALTPKGVTARLWQEHAGNMFQRLHFYAFKLYLFPR